MTITYVKGDRVEFVGTTDRVDCMGEAPIVGTVTNTRGESIAVEFDRGDIGKQIILAADARPVLTAVGAAHHSCRHCGDAHAGRCPAEEAFFRKAGA